MKQEKKQQESVTVSDNDSPEARWARRTIVLLLSFMLIYTLSRQYDAYQVIGTHMYPELPIYAVDIGQDKRIAVTFDSAWGTEDLDEILSILNRHHCPAAFFVTGDWATEHPEAVCKIMANGHTLGNHGNHHKHMTTLSEQDMREEINGCHEAVKAVADTEMQFFRAPYGDYNAQVVEAAKACGYQTIQWSVDSLDWKDYGADAIIRTVSTHKNLKGGAIILLHNGSTYTRNALDSLLTRLEEDGYSFSSLEELVYTGQYTIDHTGTQHKAE